MAKHLSGQFEQRHRLLIIAPHFAELALRFAQAMSRRYQVLLLVEHHNLLAECGTEAKALAPNVAIEAVRGGRRISWTLALVRALLLFRPHLVQIEETTNRILSSLVRLSRVCAPVVLRVHDVDLHSGRDSVFSTDRAAARDFIRKHADSVMVHGRYCHDAFAERYHTPVIETVHGVILVPDSASRREPERGHILMFGRMEEYKGLETLLEAFEILAGRGLSFRATIAGQGPEIKRLQALLAGRPEVEVLDRFITRSEVDVLFQRAEIIALPYKDATQSGVVAAAFAQHRIVVASRVGGIPDVVEEGVNGLLVPPSNANALADALEILLTSSDLAQYLQLGAVKTANTTLNWNSIADKIAASFLDMIEARRQV